MTEPSPAAETDAEDELVVASRTDREAFGRLFDRFYPPVLRYALRRLVVRAAAEDATSEAFLHAAAHVSEFPGTTIEDFRRWLFRIATNEINARLRQTLRRRELLEAAARSGAVRAAVSTEPQSNGRAADWDEVHRALLDLPERDQSIVSLRYFAGLDPAQIAGTLRMTPGAVRTALSRTLQKLRDRLLGPSLVRNPTPDDASSGRPR